MKDDENKGSQMWIAGGAWPRVRVTEPEETSTDRAVRLMTTCVGVNSENIS